MGTKINRIQTIDGLIYYEAIFKDGSTLNDFKIRSLIWQLMLIYGIDLRCYLFKHSEGISPMLGVIDYSQLN